MFDETVNYCKIFKGPQEEIYDDCFELGFSSYPFISECQTVLDPVNNDQCHVNFCIFLCLVYMFDYKPWGYDHVYLSQCFSISDKIIVGMKRICWII